MSHVEYDDKVWLNEDCKLRGICSEVEGARAGHQTVLIVAYFEDTLASLENALQARASAYQRYSLLYFSSLCEVEPGTLVTALARDFPGTLGTVTDSARPAPLRVIIAEHHPLLAREQDLLQAVTALPCTEQICFHCALTNPLMVRFGGASLQKMSERLGLDEQAPLSHSLISSAIQKAQAKIGKQVYADVEARSAAEWFQLNFPDGSK